MAVGATLSLGAATGLTTAGPGSGSNTRFHPASAIAASADTASTSPSAGWPADAVAPSANPGKSTPAKPSASARSASSGRAAKQSGKKGVSTWYFDGVGQALGGVKASWYYNWAADKGQVTAPAGVEFVPMIWGAKAVNAETLGRAKAQGHTLLGFNEPDFSSQANLPVQQALDLWPQLMATGMRLGSPAPATGAADPGGWLDQFMAGAAARNYRVDFITLHWYGSDFSPAATDHLKGYLQAVYQRYHKPIWLTEYALIKFAATPVYPTQEQQAAFVRASTTMMEGLPYVERYAWFALPTNKDGDGTGLYRDATTPTTVGAAYGGAGTP